MEETLRDYIARKTLNLRSKLEIAADIARILGDICEGAFCSVYDLEVPTPRWVIYGIARLGAETSKDAKLTHQDRAYTSPIWCTPAN